MGSNPILGSFCCIRPVISGSTVEGLIMGKEKFEALIKGSYERGVRVFDLADLYGTHPYHFVFLLVLQMVDRAHGL